MRASATERSQCLDLRERTQCCGHPAGPMQRRATGRIRALPDATLAAPRRRTKPPRYRKIARAIAQNEPTANSGATQFPSLSYERPARAGVTRVLHRKRTHCAACLPGNRQGR